MIIEKKELRTERANRARVAPAQAGNVVLESDQTSAENPVDVEGSLVQPDRPFSLVSLHLRDRSLFY